MLSCVGGVLWVCLKRVECRRNSVCVGITGGRMWFFLELFRLARICGPGSPLVGWAIAV
jgi:hypothetical protein